MVQEFGIIMIHQFGQVFMDFYASFVVFWSLMCELVYTMA